MRVVCFGVLFLFVLLAVPLNAAKKIDPEKFRGTLTTSQGGGVVYYRTHPFNRSHPSVRRVVIVVHGLGRTANGYFRAVYESAQADHRGVGTAIVAPRFPIASDNPATGLHTWTGGWAIGHRSLAPKRISSYRVIDEVFDRLRDRKRFPNLSQVVLAGHSAGGQFVNRYAAGGLARVNQGVRLKFLVMNPSSYIYLDKRRPVPGKAGMFAEPKGVKDFNRYKYGMDNLNVYMKARGREAILKQMQARRVYYLGGTQDMGSKNLATSPPAMVQGRHRFERWRNYRMYVKLFPEWSRNAVFRPVSGIGHSGSRMFNSAAAKQVLFH
jgi:pimeloyl-ACP methyl ester carboxylesterase